MDAEQRPLEGPFPMTRKQFGRLLASSAIVVGCSAIAEAHAVSDEPVGRENWFTAWNWDPLILSNLIVISVGYAIGIRRMWARGGWGRTVTGWQVAAFGASILVLFAALVSPIDPLSDELSSVHMIQHMLLMMVAAPLFVLGAPSNAIVWFLPPSWRARFGAWWSPEKRWNSFWYWLWQPVLLWLLYAFTLWVWHHPVLYQAALRNEWVHEFQHLTFFVAACLFWRVLVDPLTRMRIGRGLGVLYLFTTSLHASVLGIFMALSPRPWYGDYAEKTEFWNLTPLEDQQLAGLIMWMPACMMYALAAAAIFAIWLREAGTSREAR